MPMEIHTNRTMVLRSVCHSLDHRILYSGCLCHALRLFAISIPATSLRFNPLHYLTAVILAYFRIRKKGEITMLYSSIDKWKRQLLSMKKRAESSGAANELLIQCMQIFYVILFFCLSFVKQIESMKFIQNLVLIWMLNVAKKMNRRMSA